MLPFKSPWTISQSLAYKCRGWVGVFFSHMSYRSVEISSFFGLKEGQPLHRVGLLISSTGYNMRGTSGTLSHNAGIKVSYFCL